jgi:hypothetical protein
VTVEVDAKGPLAALDAIVRRLQEFPSQMADELTTWQRDDMNRVKYVNTSLVGNAAETIITQHTHGTLTIVKKSQRARYSRRKGRRSGGAGKGGVYHHWHHGKKYSQNATKTTRTYRRRVREARSDAKHHGKHQTSTMRKPILRPILFDMLCQRMGTLMEEKLSFDAH